MKKLIPLALALLLTACASSGHKFTIQQANQIQNGMTREQVVKIMGGKPNSITNQGKTFIWSYAKVNGFTGGHRSRAVKIDFDENNMSYGIPPGGVYGDTEKFQ
ncbi:outer membrane protein assembly factor BamE domain-containing protein [Diaphorobacter caeni]|uniref:outer membrane protein assembly factor BamE domain-containing protein n=1 Tax=Diaphorobacter caeni TaxID=2784387 RepID=UPI00189055E7|nr:outer membrane protein assembly factor BamE [Diaphorobacter caeni]MBF5004762.1 outer membrane protein assembly factor BamE [Diaphorobacter caeni]